jgi:hypothetical protein
MSYRGRELTSGNYLKLDDIQSQFNGSTTTFNLTSGGSAFYPGSAFSLLVSLAGVVQEAISAYTINQNTITFASAPQASDDFFCVVLGTALGIGVPGEGTVSGSKLTEPFDYDDGMLYLDSASDRVGINSTAPRSSLDVRGNVIVAGVVTATTFSGSFTGALTGTATSTTNIPNLTGAITSSNTTTSLGSFTSANLATALTDETGSGSAVFSTSPTLVTPVLGAATATSIVVSSGSTFTNGPILVGTATSTGTASQPLQVTGGAYVSGNIGIGTTNPGAKLQVTPTSTGIAGLFSGTTSSDMVRITQLGTGNAIVVEDETNPDSSPFVVTGAGSVGIGTINPIQKVDIVTGVGDGTANETNAIRLRHSSTSGNAMTLQMGVNNVAGGGGGGSINQGYGYLQSVYWGGGNNTIALNPKGGGVAVGSNFAATALDVTGDLLLKTTGTNTQLSKVGFNGVGVYSQFPTFIGAFADNGVWSNGMALTFNTIRSGDVSGSTGLERMRVSSDGNLLIATATSTGTASQPLQVTGGAYVSGSFGIGTTNPTSKLDVVGSIRAVTSTTSATTVRIGNTGNNVFLGVESSTGGTNIIGSTAYAGTLSSNGPLQFSINNGASIQVTINASGNVGIGTINPQYKLHVNGSFAATTKSFVIDHPTKPNYKLRYASLEGEENGVYVRGRTTENIIELPEYWTELVDKNSITVNLTPIGNKHIWIEEINNNKVYIDSDSSIDCFYTVFAERKDVEKLIVEIQEN